MNRTASIDEVIKMLLKGIGLLILTWYLIEGRQWSYLGNVPDGEALGKRLAERGQSPKRCFKTFEIFPSYPPLSDAQFVCLNAYAKVSKDAYICDIIPPSKLLLSCIGAAEPDQACGINQDFELGWGSIAENNKSHTSFANCFQKEPASSLGKECCEVAKTGFIRNYDTCSTLSIDMADACYRELAFKLGSDKPCKKIHDERKRKACDMYIKYKTFLNPIQVFEEKDFQPKQ